MARSTKAAAPTATSTLVRRPAVRWRYCRSAPISVPSTKAVVRLISVSRKSASWKVVKNRMVTLYGQNHDRSKFEKATIPIFVGERQQRALGVPRNRSDRRRAVAADENFRAILQTHHQHGAVAVAGGEDVVLRVASDDRDAGLERREHRGLLAHRAVLAGERPYDDGVGARGRQPLAAHAPGHRTDAAGIAGHAHVPVVGEPPAVQRRLMHRCDQEFVIRAEGDAEMRAGPGQEFG